MTARLARSSVQRMALSPSDVDKTNPAGSPEAALEMFERAITVEFTSLTRAGAPIMVPLTPFLGEDRLTVDVSTGLSYPTKAERARRNPKVCLLFSDPVGSGLNNPPIVLVQGLATVRDKEIQANTDRYVRLALGKLPAAYQGIPRVVLRRLTAYFARIWIEVTPTDIWWWESNSLDQEPHQWTAPATTVAPPSDLAPTGKQPAAWLEPPGDWGALAERAIDRLEQRDLAWVDSNGFPLSVPVLGVERIEDVLRLRLGDHLPAMPDGAACLTFHEHPETFTGQENQTFIGTVGREGEDYVFDAERALADFSLPGNRFQRTVHFLRNIRRLSPRVASEAGRRGQPVPKINLPQAS